MLQVAKNPSAITIAIPSSASDDPHANLYIQYEIVNILIKKLNVYCAWKKGDKSKLLLLYTFSSQLRPLNCTLQYYSKLLLHRNLANIDINLNTLNFDLYLFSGQ